VVALQGNSVSAAVPAANEVLKWNGAAWTPAVDNNTTYDAGTGISLSANTFSAQNTAPIWNANQIQGNAISTTAPSNNELLRWNGTEWLPSAEIAYDAGTGISLTANTFVAQNTNPIWNANQIMGSSISTTAPAANNVLTWNGTEWVPAAAQLTYYEAGTGLTLTSNTFSANNTSPIWNANQLQSSSVSAAVPTNNQVLRYSGGSWTPSDEIIYDAGTGISLSGSSFSHIAHTGDAVGSTSITVTGLQGRPIATTTPTSGNVLKWDGTQWAMAFPSDSFNANKAITRPGWTGVSGQNMGTNTNVADFLNAVFFPFIPATITMNAGTIWEIGTSNTLTITGSTTANSETVFSNGRVDRVYPTTATIYSFGAAMSFTTTANFTPDASVASSLEIRFVAYQDVGNNGSPTTINSPTRITTSVYPYFHSTSTTDFTSGGTQLYTGLTKVVQAQGNKTFTYNGTGYLYFCYPSTYGALTSILDQNSFEQLGAFNVTTQTVNSSGLVNNWGTTYYIYSSKTISTPSNYNFTFRY
jgi:hypothetical protein